MTMTIMKGRKLCQRLKAQKNIIPPVTDWGSRKQVAMALVELRDIVVKIVNLMEEYKTKNKGRVASGAGYLDDTIELFLETLPTCFSEVNNLNESSNLLDISNDLERSRQLLESFIAVNQPNLINSPLNDGNVGKLFNVVIKLEDALKTIVSRIRHVTIYY